MTDYDDHRTRLSIDIDPDLLEKWWDLVHKGDSKRLIEALLQSVVKLIDEQGKAIPARLTYEVSLYDLYNFWKENSNAPN